ncbi:MAG: hypothetical protein NWR52_00395, partial [Paracoccaceae bacterium]|nr:hypothetical protein [Paracoccaceae bacterium]
MGKSNRIDNFSICSPDITDPIVFPDKPCLASARLITKKSGKLARGEPRASLIGLHVVDGGQWTEVDAAG